MKYNNCCYSQSKEIIFLKKEKNKFTSRFASISFKIPTAEILRDLLARTVLYLAGRTLSACLVLTW